MVATHLLAFFSLASIVVASTIPAQGVSSCHASDRVLVDTHNVTAGGYEFQVSTKACSADVLQVSSPSSRTLQKRTTFATCGFGGAFECIRNEGIAPLPADCLALNNAFIAAFIGPTRNCIYAVHFVQEFSLGTCLWAWINENPNTVNGATLTECYGWLPEFLAFNLNSSCMVSGATAGFVVPGSLSNPDPRALDYTFEILHS
ncbi:hypothetical protein B0H13DRAFT_2338549 [Mycena leptocephala]|nr:hypothetical protein B0H13DRAFT_2338549 [Mycena leptocephala]